MTMDGEAVARRLRNSLEWSSALAIAAAVSNASIGYVALQGSKGHNNTGAVLAFLGIVALGTGFFFFLSLLMAPSMVDDEKPGWAHAIAMPLVFVVELKTLLGLLSETRYNVRYFPEVSLADKVANSPVTLLSIFLCQVVVLVIWVLSDRRKSQ